MTFRHLPAGLVRAALVAAGLIGLALPASALDRLSLRGDIATSRDALTLGDLVENAPAALADTALFRSPNLGQAGTIQVGRIVQAADGLGLGAIETGGRLQVTVTRAARSIGAGEIEAALRKALAEKHGFEESSTDVAFDGPSPNLLLPPDLKGDVTVIDLLLDRRTKRVAATVAVGPSSVDRRASLRVTGAIVDMVEVAVLSRTLDRGETVRPADVATERRPRDAVPTDAVSDGAPLAGRVARRLLGAGSLVRAGDLTRPELVGKGEIITAVYETPGMFLSMRVKASEAGALGDVIAVVNPNSRKALQATVVAPGKVSVKAGATERVLASNPLPTRP